ncbi:MAG: cation-translocating P-type ATPase [Candidatus Woesearchaeota archaeon]
MYHAKPITTLYKELETSEQGLSEQQVAQRLAKDGLNVSYKEQKISAFKIFRNQFGNLIIYILYLAAFLSVLLGEMIEYYAIMSIIIIIVLLGFFEEYKAGKDMAALQKLTPQYCKVIRNGKKQDILAEQLVRGDLLVLQRGDIVPADARVVQTSHIKVDESALTGESLAISKQTAVIDQNTELAQRTNMVYAGSPVTSGEALCVVVETGLQTELGKIAHMLHNVKEQLTPLQKRMYTLSKQFSITILVICVLIFITGILQGFPLNKMLILTIAVAVAGIPESLPAVLAVVLAVGTKRMAKQNAIIKRLPAVETLGTCSVICTDKTGTLTQNKMVVEEVYTLDGQIHVTGTGLDPIGEFIVGNKVINPKNHKTLSQILTISALCNNATLNKEKNEYSIDGEATEGALMVLAHKAGLRNLHGLHPRVHEHPFDADRKCMSVIHKVKGKHIAYAKGAPEYLLKKCTRYMKNGKSYPLSKEMRSVIIHETESYAQRGLRVLGLAYKEHNATKLQQQHVESGLTFVGLIAIRDPPHPTVKQAIVDCQTAGIKVVMITGDNPVTARCIAEELGIYQHTDTVLTGQELDVLSDTDLYRIANQVSVYARATPKHKLRIVQALQHIGHIVAMTGDGVNDAPALKAADIGVAMGKKGTEVAKEASEMVIKDDNFATIVTAVKEGRNIYQNIRKFIYYLLVGNFSQVIIIFVSALLGVLSPLTALMVLFVNLVTSEFPALGLSMERSSPNIMQYKPRSPKEPLLNEYLLFKIAQVIPFVVLGTLIIYVWQLGLHDATKAQTMAFVTIIMFMMMHAFNARSFSKSIFNRYFFSNGWFFASVIFSFAATLCVIYIPVLQGLFQTVALSLSDWLIVFVVTSFILLFVEIQKTAIQNEMREQERLLHKSP